MSNQKFIIISILTVFISTLAYGQINNGALDAFGRPILIDTTTNENDTIINKNGFFSLFKGKPGRAAFYSLVIPSGGQIYNKRWWKVPLALGIDGGLTYVLINNRKLYGEAQDLYEIALNDKDPLASRYKDQRDYYRKWSEYAWVWLIGGHLLTVIDAYVDRHLMDFDVSPDLTLSQNYGLDSQSNIAFSVHAGVKINLTPKVQKTPNQLLLSR
jgi:hypothetical protein